MNKLTLFFVIAFGFVAYVFWTHTQEKMAKERCIMAGGLWSETDGECSV